MCTECNDMRPKVDFVQASPELPKSFHSRERLTVVDYESITTPSHKTHQLFAKL